MGLPIQATPIYTLIIPSSKKQLKYRPFLVKEEKSLLIAYQSEDEIIMVDTIKKIIKDCALSEINVDQLATFDIEYIFTQLRAKSIGEFVELIFKCHCVEPNVEIKVDFDISKIEVLFPEDHTNNIVLFDNIGIKMKYPTLDVIKEIQNIHQNDAEQMFNIIIQCIDYIFDDKQIFAAKDQNIDELKTFIENLTTVQFKNIQKFFETMPRIKKEVEYQCPRCEKHHQYTLEGLSNFF